MLDELTLPQAAVRLRVGYSVAQRLALSGAFGPVRQERGRWRIPAAGVAAYLAAREAANRPVAS